MGYSNDKEIAMKIPILILAFSVFLLGGATQQSKDLCKQGSASLSYAIENFDQLYVQDYSLFWSIFHAAEKKAVSCESIDDTARFLSVARVKEGNAEFNEYFSEVLEKNLLMNNARCLFDALLRLDDQSKKIIMWDLRHPLYIQKEKLEEIINPLMDEAKYKELLELYYQ